MAKLFLDLNVSNRLCNGSFLMLMITERGLVVFLSLPSTLMITVTRPVLWFDSRHQNQQRLSCWTAADTAELFAVTATQTLPPPYDNKSKHHNMDSCAYVNTSDRNALNGARSGSLSAILSRCLHVGHVRIVFHDGRNPSMKSKSWVYQLQECFLSTLQTFYLSKH